MKRDKDIDINKDGSCCHHINPNERISMKRYVANTSVSIVVNLPHGKSRRVSFTPLTGNGSVFYTDNHLLQHALESHYRYGSLFRIDPFFKPHHLAHGRHSSVNSCHELNATAMIAPVECKPKRKMQFTDHESAKDYLCDHYGFLRTKLRSPKAIEEAAEQKGIEIEIGA